MLNLQKIVSLATILTSLSVGLIFEPDGLASVSDTPLHPSAEVMADPLLLDLSDAPSLRIALQREELPSIPSVSVIDAADIDGIPTSREVETGWVCGAPEALLTDPVQTVRRCYVSH